VADQLRRGNPRLPGTGPFLDSRTFPKPGQRASVRRVHARAPCCGSTTADEEESSMDLVTAIAAGAAAGVSRTASQAVRDAYEALKTLLRTRFPRVDVAPLEELPGSAAKQASLAEDLARFDVDRDAEVMRLTFALVAAVGDLARGARGGRQGWRGPGAREGRVREHPADRGQRHCARRRGDQRDHDRGRAGRERVGPKLTSAARAAPADLPTPASSPRIDFDRGSSPRHPRARGTSSPQPGTRRPYMVEVPQPRSARPPNPP
jgi:hypothetical protein